VPTASKGVRLAIDVGSQRIGIARCDQDQILAVPVATLVRDGQHFAEILRLANEHKVELIYVGNPISLKGSVTKSTQDAVDFALDLAIKTELPIRLVDERLSTVTAQTNLRSAGKSTRTSRKVIDQVAAVIILDHALAIEKAKGTLAGEPVTDFKVL